MFTNDYIFLDTLKLWFLKPGRERHEYRDTSQHQHIIFMLHSAWTSELEVSSFSWQRL